MKCIVISGSLAVLTLALYSGQQATSSEASAPGKGKGPAEFRAMLKEKAPKWLESPRGKVFTEKADDWAKAVGDFKEKEQIDLLISHNEPTMAYILWGGEKAKEMQTRIHERALESTAKLKSAHKILIITNFDAEKCEALYTRILAAEPKDAVGRPPREYKRGSALWAEIKPPETKTQEDEEKNAP